MPKSTHTMLSNQKYFMYRNYEHLKNNEDLKMRIAQKIYNVFDADGSNGIDMKEFKITSFFTGMNDLNIIKENFQRYDT